MDFSWSQGVTLSGAESRALAVFGKGLRSFGAYRAGKERSRSLKAQAAARYAEAAEVRRRGLWEMERLNEAKRQMLSTQRALAGEAGVTLEGAPQDLIGRTRSEFLADRLQLAANTAAEAARLDAEAHELRRGAKAARRAGTLEAFSSFF